MEQFSGGPKSSGLASIALRYNVDDKAKVGPQYTRAKKRVRMSSSNTAVPAADPGYSAYFVKSLDEPMLVRALPSPAWCELKDTLMTYGFHIG